MTLEDEYVELTLFDPGTASFVSAWVTYLYPRHLISSIQGGESKVPDSITLLASKSYETSPWKFEHTNVWGFPYSLSADRMKQNSLYLELNGKLVRAISLQFQNLTVVGRDPLPPLPLSAESAWGNRGVLTSKDGWTQNVALFIDREFSQREEIALDDAAPSEFGYRQFFNEIFADG